MAHTDSFTPQEREIIDNIYAKELQGLTAEEAKLYARWEAAKALDESENQAALDAFQKELDAKTAALQEEHAYAMETLQMMRDASLARLKAAENGA